MFQQKDAHGNLLKKSTVFLTIISMSPSVSEGRAINGIYMVSALEVFRGKSVAAGAAKYTDSLVHAVLKAYDRSCSDATESTDLFVSSIGWQNVCPDGSTKPLQQIIRLHKSPAIQHDLSTASDDWCFVADPTQVTYQFAHDPSIAQFAASVVRDDEKPLQPVPAPNDLEEQELQKLSPQQRRALSQEIGKAHRGMGHPNHSRFLRILKLGGASPATMALAKMYSCSQCKENTRPKPWRRASPPRELKFNEVVGIDTFTVKHFDHSIKCLNIICWGTRYQMVILLQGERTADARAAYRQWVSEGTQTRSGHGISKGFPLSLFNRRH